MAAFEQTRIIGHLTADPQARVSNTELRSLLEYWKSQRQTRLMPSRHDIDIPELNECVGNLFLIEVVSRPYGFRFRLVGAGITSRIGQELTGRPVDQMFTGDHRRAMIDLCASVVARKQPLSIEACLIWRDQPYIRCEALLLPLASDGSRVDMIFGGFAWS